MDYQDLPKKIHNILEQVATIDKQIDYVHNADAVPRDLVRVYIDSSNSNLCGVHIALALAERKKQLLKELETYKEAHEVLTKVSRSMLN